MNKHSTALRFIVLAQAMFLSSCATLKSNTFIGAAIGASAGAVSGTVIGAPNHSATGTLIGAASGAALGALIGYITEPKTPSSSSSTASNLNLSEDTDPKFSTPEVRRVWVPDQIDGNKYVKGHYMYILERGSVWTMH